MNILGIHGGVTAYQHDPSAALVVDGALVCFVSEERLNRIKNSFRVWSYENTKIFYQTIMKELKIIILKIKIVYCYT